MAFKMKGPSMYKGSPMKVDNPTVEQQIAAADKKFGEGGIKTNTGPDKRDVLAKQARTSYSGTAKPGMEQSVRSQSYKDAEEYMASKGSKEAKKLLRDRAKRVAAEKKRLAESKDAPTKLIKKKLKTSGATLIKTKKKKRGDTVKKAIEAAKNAPSESESSVQVTPTKRFPVKPKNKTKKYKKVPGFNS